MTTTVRSTPCDCGHPRGDHTPDGCSVCDCALRAPYTTRRPDGSVAENWREPFEPGNQVAVRHGATSPALVSKRSRAVLAELTETMPWLADADAMTLDALCRAKAVFDPVDEYVADVITGAREAYPRRGAPKTGVEAVPDHVWRQWRGNLKLIGELAGKLGMNPVDRSQLMKDTGLARHFGREGAQQMIERGKVRLAELRDGTCPCGHPRSKHTLSGCSQCDCRTAVGGNA